METENKQNLELPKEDIKKPKKKNSVEYNKNYYATNKDKISEKMKSKVKCQYCDKETTYQHLYRHQLTKLCKSIHKRKIERKLFEENIKNNILLELD